LNSKKTCVFLERQVRQPRPQKPKRSSKARICALESKVDDLIAFASQSQLVHGQATSQPTAGLLENGLSVHSSSPSHGEQNSTPGSSQNNSTIASHPDCAFHKWADYPKLNGLSCPELLLECGLSIDAADGLLNRFRTMASYFPFFMIPCHITVLTMCKEQPFALIAALAATASADKELQTSLDDKFKLCALHAIMIDNERSLDLLNGILVYLAWWVYVSHSTLLPRQLIISHCRYQFYYIPKKEQLNQLLHIAIGMVVDMGLNLRPAEAMSRKVGLRLTHYRKFSTPSANHDEFFCREARRAYLGCFYLSSM
jgi:hypothetical protein